MTVKYIDATPRPETRIVYCSKLLTIRPGFFLSKKTNCTKVQIFSWKRHTKKKRSATMQHSTRTLFHITYTILSHKQAVVPTI